MDTREHLNETDNARPFHGISDDIAPYRRPGETTVFEGYSAIIRRLRAPDGCPWDRKQTLNTLRRFIIEESFELLTAIHDFHDHTHTPGDATGDTTAAESVSHTAAAHVAEELGDVLLVTMLIAGAVEQETGISLEQVLRENGEKLIRRHPHVFADAGASTAEQVVTNWNRIKKEQEGREDSPSSVGSNMPPLERAYEIQRKAEKLGFDWEPHDIATPIAKLREEIDEIEERITELGADRDPNRAKDDPSTEHEIGDLLFSAVNVSRKLKTDPSVALSRTNDRFLRRFGFIESSLHGENKEIRSQTIADLDLLWEEAKRRERIGD